MRQQPYNNNNNNNNNNSYHSLLLCRFVHVQTVAEDEDWDAEEKDGEKDDKVR